MDVIHAVIETSTDRVVALCELEVKARFFVKVSPNREYRKFHVLHHTDGKEYISLKACNIIKATIEDQEEQDRLARQRNALVKAQGAGMTREEIQALISIDRGELE